MEPRKAMRAKEKDGRDPGGGLAEAGGAAGEALLIEGCLTSPRAGTTAPPPQEGAREHA